MSILKNEFKKTKSTVGKISDGLYLKTKGILWYRYIQNKKAASSKEIKELDIEAKKQLGSGSNKTGNTNILIATREEVIERFLDKNKKYIEAGIVEPTSLDDE